MFLAYHSEVLQKERDMLRKSRLSSPTNAERERDQGDETDSGGVRRAGGGSHRFTAMAEAALAQVGMWRVQVWDFLVRRSRSPPSTLWVLLVADGCSCSVI